ncbi:DNA repair photolyase [Dysgonomonas sp. PFB1-18]|uniref:hypothetical protein n=1 Tax=unclassified Dysgonomonas TaxID=2630389 RepID=UPI0024753DA9|nr:MULTISPECIES: hypothetical protein [unclassified Dysgonomonas]MDH6308079.1 DNA repair photolyase [Dysgonomonas sp. PF1-14]MDH6339618.1 DNA repair photolyase [Dysgonomonas sp. PF1-16]MDH6381269.1 DNA repair photolyase [Dysgonomonas sp. PFB1-18]MDH6398481.1 DNA repair photolyase [Dysgonomonas sp. PF1-23]
MGLNNSKGNMYDFVTHTWNAIKGACLHDCSYCYMKRWGKLNPVRLDESEFKTDLGAGNFIFVGSSCDMFAEDIPEEWILKVLNFCYQHDNRYLIQSKNPARILEFINHPIFSKKAVVCTTLESNVFYPEVMKNSPAPLDRSAAMSQISHCGVPTYVTIEPIMEFSSLVLFSEMIKQCNPVQVNIGADSGNNHLPEPSIEKIEELINAIKEFTTINRKSNLKRILK